MNEREQWVMDINAIREILPHRYPFLLIDRISKIHLNPGGIGSQIEGVKAVSGNEPYFQGHFPDLPIMPGVLLIETMAQTAGLLVLKCLGEEKRHSFYLAGVDRARFRRPVIPGDILRIASEVVKKKAAFWVTKTEIFVEDKLVAEAGLYGSVSAV